MTDGHQSLLNSAIQLQQSGRIHEALNLYSRILVSQPNDAQLLYLAGLAHFQVGQFQQGMALFERSLAIVPDNAAAHNNIGLALQAFKQLDEALAIYGKALVINPDYAYAHHNRGNVLQELKRPDEALASYDRALAINPNYSDSHCNRGLALQELNRPYEALASFDKSLVINPGNAVAYYNRGNVLRELKRLDEALASYNNALAVNPNYADAHCNRAVVLHERKQWNEALASCDSAVAINPDFAAAYANRGNALQELGRLDEALASFAKALAISPDHAETYYNRGNVLKELNRLDEALASYDKALALSPDNAAIHYNRGAVKMLMGRLHEGLALYEWRKKFPTPIEARAYDQPLWTGSENLHGKALYLYVEQGLGDTIQFYRYAHLARMRGARIILSVQNPLVRLLQGASPEIEIVGDDVVPSSFDFHAPLMSLPLAFGTTMNSIPGTIPFLHPDQQRMKKWRERIGSHGLKIGICWQGGTEISGRSFPLALLAPIAGLQGVRLISLQKGHGLEQLALLPSSMAVETLDDLDADTGAFLDTVSLLPLLDLIITADTSVAHVAGTLNCPTWLALKHVPDWRWFMDRRDSPWYPSLRLFRQPTPGDWGKVFTEMYSRLSAGAR